MHNDQLQINAQNGGLFEEDSVCSYQSDVDTCISSNWRGWNHPSKRQNRKKEDEGMKNLMELCAQKVAHHVPFEQVEKMFFPVPENVLLRIAYWSFPDKEQDIRLYSILANGSSDEFNRGEKLVRKKCVMNMLQIGFHLSANVSTIPPLQLAECQLSNMITPTPYAVAVSFDRCKITMCTCDCPSSYSWCSHVIALCLYRIHQPEKTKLRSPVSESLSRLNRDQLQKFSQYLICELPQQILPVAQNILDDLLSSNSQLTINMVAGAPDPTAGPGMNDNCLWYLDEVALKDKVKKTLIKFCGPSPVVFSDVQYMSNTEPPAVAEYSSLLRPLRAKEPEGIWNLLCIVREMLQRQDSNSVQLLDIVTDQCLSFDQVAMWWYYTKTSTAYLEGSIATASTYLRTDAERNNGGGNNNNQGGGGNNKGNANSEIAQFAAASMLDEIVALWRLVVLDPSASDTWRQEQKTRLKVFHQKTFEQVRRGRFREVNLDHFEAFNPAIIACDFDWSASNIVQCRHILPKSCLIPKLTDSNNNKKEEKKEDDFQDDKVYELPGSLLNRLEDATTTTFGLLEVEDKDDKPNTNKLVEESNKSTNQVLECIKGMQRLDMASTEEATTSDVLVGDKPEETATKLKKEKLTKMKPDDMETRYRDEIDALFTRTESLYAHGRYKEACELAVRLAEEILEKPDDFSYKGNDSAMTPADKREWIKETTPRAKKSLEYILLLCNVLIEHDEFTTLAFLVGLQGLELKRPPASSKALEVNLLHKQNEIALLMKRLPLYENEVVRLHEKAVEMTMVDATTEVNFVLPILLADFMFDSFCSAKPNQYVEAGQNDTFIQNSQFTVLQATLNALRFKISVSELDHPLLCEGTRRQKGDLVLKMLELYKDNQRILRMTLSSVLDKSLTPNLRTTSAFANSNSFSGGAVASGGQLSTARSNNANRIDHPTVRAPSVDSSDDENRARNSVCSPSRRDSSRSSWRSPTVRAKRKLHCIANVNSSASEEAMLSDTSPRLRRRNLNNAAAAQMLQSGAVAGGNVAAGGGGQLNSQQQQQQPGSSSDSGSDSARSRIKRKRDNGAAAAAAAASSSSATSPPPLASNQQRGNQQANTSSYNNRNYQTRRGNYRGRNCLSVPDQPNQPSEAAAHFFFELAKNVLVKAGGNSSTSLFTHVRQQHGADQSLVNRNLVLAAFEIGLFSLGLSNSVTPHWVSRTYSSHVSWITGQAMEIGGAAIKVLIDSWEGHLTAPEISALADRASHGRDAATVQKAAELALTILPFASALNLNEIHRALNQCKDQGPAMLEKACQAVEQAGKGGGVFPEVLFDVAQMWEWIHRQVKTETKVTTTNSRRSTPVNTIDAQQQQFAAPQGIAGIPTTQHQQHQLPVSVGGVVIPSGMITIQNCMYLQPNLTMCPPSHLGAPIFPTAPGFPAGLLEQQMAHAGMRLPGLPYAAVHIHPNNGTTINLLPLAPAALMAPQQYQPPPGAPPPPPFLQQPPDPAAVVRQQQVAVQQRPPPALHHHPNLIPIPTNQHPVSYQLQKAFKVGMLALELLAKKTEDRPNNKYARNPPYASNVKWVLKLSKKLGPTYVQQFCITVVAGVSSPFVLYDIALEAATFFIDNQQQQVNQHNLMVNFRLSCIVPIVNRCVQMFVHFINNRLYHIHSPNDHEDFINLVKSSRHAFSMMQTGQIQFNEILTTINRSKACKKDLWQKLNAALSLPP